MLVRIKTNLKKNKNSSRKNKSNRKNSGDLQAKVSHRSGEIIFKGGGMPERRGQDSYRNGLVYAKALSDMPDYSSFATRETEKQLGPFVYDVDPATVSDLEIITRGPYELDNQAIYQGQWTKDGLR
jgi:hypothetical protein